MTARGIHHLGVAVADLDEALATLETVRDAVAPGSPRIDPG